VTLYSWAHPLKLRQLTLGEAPSISTEKIELGRLVTDALTTIVPGPSPGALVPPPWNTTGTFTLPTPSSVAPGTMISSVGVPFTTSSGPTTCTEPVNKLTIGPLTGTNMIGVVVRPARAEALVVNVVPGPSTKPPRPLTVPVRFSVPPLTAVSTLPGTVGEAMAPDSVTLFEFKLITSMPGPPGGAPRSFTGCGIVRLASATNVPLLRVSVLVAAPSDDGPLMLRTAPLVTVVPPW
jgi:hypothetical protein